MSHTIFTTDAYQDYKYYMQNPMAFIEDSLNGEDVPDDLTIIGMIQSIKEDDVWEQAHQNVEWNYDDEKGNLQFAKLTGKCVAFGTICRWNGTKEIVPLEVDAADVADILEFCANKFGNDTWSLLDKDGELVVEAYGHDNPCSPHRITFRMLDDYGSEMWGSYEEDAPSDEELIEKHSLPIGHLVQKIYGYTY